MSRRLSLTISSRRSIGSKPTGTPAHLLKNQIAAKSKKYDKLMQEFIRQRTEFTAALDAVLYYHNEALERGNFVDADIRQAVKHITLSLSEMTGTIVSKPQNTEVFEDTDSIDPTVLFPQPVKKCLEQAALVLNNIHQLYNTMMEIIREKTATLENYLTDNDALNCLSVHMNCNAILDEQCSTFEANQKKSLADLQASIIGVQKEMTTPEDH